MKNIVFVCALVAVAAGLPQQLPAPRLDGRIVGGREATIEEFPHQVSLKYYGSHACGASIISPNFVVTAAHCTDGASASILSVRAGSTYHGSGGQLLNVKRIIQHPQYNGRTMDYDISILELDGNLELNNSVKSISMPNASDDLKGGAPATCSGWGVTTEGGSVPAKLRAVELNIIGRDSCQNDYGRYYDITPRMLCAGVGGGKDACQGDSGGPLVANGQLVGVVSWGIGCARPEFPGVFSSVSNLRNYIKDNTGL